MQDPLLDCEGDIREFLAEHTTSQCPPLLAQAMEYAVFPGGARVRPQLCMAVALANNSSDRPLAAAAATAVEFLHCASLVHDDLPASTTPPSAVANHRCTPSLANALPY